MIVARHHFASRAVALLVAGCFAATCAKPPNPAEPALEHVQLEGEALRDPEGHLEGNLEARTTLQGALYGAGAGAILLATTGTVAAFLICAPTALFYAFCVAAGVVVLGGGGLVIGAAGGAVIGGIGGLPGDTAQQVTAILEKLETSRRFEQEILGALQRAVPPEKQVPRPSPLEDALPGRLAVQVMAESFKPEAIVIGRLDEVELQQHSSERLSIRMKSSMDVKWDLNTSQPLLRTCEYEWTSEIADVEDWLLDDGKRFDIDLSDGIKTTARWMARDLEAFSKKTELPESGDAPRSCYRQEG